MRTLLALWVAPLALFWGWYFLSLNDMNFGYVMLSRPLHDLVFQLYGEMLGIDPAIIPGMVAKACVFDSFLVAAIVAWRRRRLVAVDALQLLARRPEILRGVLQQNGENAADAVMAEKGRFARRAHLARLRKSEE